MISRGEFLVASAAAVTALPQLAQTSGPNARAARIASRSPFVRARWNDMTATVASIADDALRASAHGVLYDAVPHYQSRYPSQVSRVALRDAFAREGWVTAGAPVTGIFPPVGPSGIAQPFWSAPGSAEDSHHAYPGGLCVHELFNARISDRFAANYDGIYFGARKQIDRDLCVASAVYHDMMKSVVFQYNDDGTFTPELEIGATGGHHVLSGAEAIVRGHDARFVTVLLSAHAAPSLGDEVKVVTWCRAAAMLAGVDPVEFGLVKKTAGGYALAHRPPIECFISHLSDHDYVLTVLASQVVRPALAQVAHRFGVSASDEAAVNWWRLGICANASMIGLYEALLEGETAFADAVRTAHEA